MQAYEQRISARHDPTRLLSHYAASLATIARKKDGILCGVHRPPPARAWLMIMPWAAGRKSAKIGPTSQASPHRRHDPARPECRRMALGDRVTRASSWASDLL